MTGKIRACCREGFRIHLLHAYIKYNKRFGDLAIMVGLGPLCNEYCCAAIIGFLRNL